MVKLSITLLIVFTATAACYDWLADVNDGESLVRDAALDVLASLTKLSDAGWTRQDVNHFYGQSNVSTSTRHSSKQRSCKSNERQVTTVDGTSAQVCCIGDTTHCKRVACAQVIENHCCQTQPGLTNLLCTGVLSSQRMSLPASCQQRGQQSRVVINEREQKVKLKLNLH